MAGHLPTTRELVYGTVGVTHHDSFLKKDCIVFRINGLINYDTLPRLEYV